MWELLFSLFLYKTLADNDIEASNEVLSAAHFYFKLIGFTVFSIGFIFSFFLNDVFTINKEVQSVTQAVFLIYVSLSAITYLFAAPDLLLISAQKGYKVGWVKLLIEPLTIIMGFLVVVYGYSILGLAIVAISFKTTANLIRFYIIKKEYPWMRLNQKSRNAYLIKTTKYVFFEKLLNLGVNKTDYILIAYFLGVVSVANYALYTTVFSILIVLIYTTINPLVSGIGELFAKGLEERALFLWKDITSLTSFIIIFTCSVIYFVFPSFIIIWVGPHGLLEHRIFVLFVLNFALLAIMHISVAFVQAKDLFRLKMRGTILELFLNLGLSILLIPHLGVFGAILGTTGGYLLARFWFVPMLFMHAVDKTLLDYFRQISIYFFIGALVFTGQYLFQEYVLKFMIEDFAANYLDFAISLFSTGIVSLILVFGLFYLLDNNFTNTKNRITGLLSTISRK